MHQPQQLSERRKKAYLLMGTTKSVRSSLREKKRYVIYECIAEKPVTAQTLREEIRRKMLAWLGEYGYGAAGIMFLKDQGNKGVIRVNTKYVDHVKTALALVQEINNAQVIVKSVGVSGIMNKAITKFT